MHCPRCGATNSTDARTCNRCGTWLTDVGAAPVGGGSSPFAAPGSTGATPPPPPPGTGPGWGPPPPPPGQQPPPYQQPGWGGGYGYGSPYGPPPQRTNGLAIASLVLGIVGIVTCGVGSILAIIFGFVARSQIRDSHGTQSGAGMATAGIICGFVSIAIVALVFAIGAATDDNSYSLGLVLGA